MKSPAISSSSSINNEHEQQSFFSFYHSSNNFNHKSENMLFPVQLVTSNMKDESGEYYIKTEQDRAQAALQPNKPQRPKLTKNASSSSSIRSWSSKSSFGRSMTNLWDAM